MIRLEGSQMPEFSTLSVEGCIEEEGVRYYTQQCGLVPRTGFLSLSGMHLNSA